MHLTNNVRLTTMCTQQPFSVILVMQNIQESQDESKHNENKKGLCGWKYTFALGKNGGHTPVALLAGTVGQL